MRRVHEQNGICFVLLRFTSTNETYLLDAAHLCDFYEKQHETRKSIRKSDIERLGHTVKIGYHPRIDYLSVVEQVYLS